MKIAIGNDHAGPAIKGPIIEHLENRGHTVIDVGTNSADSCDYADYGAMVAKKVINNEADCGVLICGTGVGISGAANKIKGIRDAVCSEPTTAKLVKQHNNANIIAFGARIVGIETAKDILDAYLDAEFEGGRHQRRIDKIAQLE